MTRLRLTALISLVLPLALSASGCGRSHAAPAGEAVERTASPAPSSDHDSDAPDVIRFAKNPEPLPAVSLKTLDGKQLAWTAWSGEVMLVNFWATWCGPCREEVPALVELQKKYSDKLQVIGLSVDDGPTEKVAEFVRKYGVNYPVAIAPDEIQDQFGGVAALPTTFVVNPQGNIVQKHVGLWPVAVYEAEVRALAGLPVAARVETFEDTGQIFLKNAERATELPGVDLSKLTPEQKKAALRQMNSEHCSCGCTLTLAQCRITDSSCTVSAAGAKEIVDQIIGKPAAKTVSSPKN